MDLVGGIKPLLVAQLVPLPHISAFVSVRLFAALRELMLLSLWGTSRASKPRVFHMEISVPG